MSYTDSIPQNQFSRYKLIKNWVDFTSTPLKLINNQFTLRYYIIESDVVLEGEEFEYALVFEHCYFRGHLQLGFGTFRSFIRFYDCYIDEGMVISRATFDSELLLLKVYIKGDFLFLGSKGNDCGIDLWDCRDVKFMDLNFTKLNLHLSKTTISSVDLMSIGEKTSGKLSLRGFDAKITRLSLTGGSKDYSISIEQIIISKFTIQNFRNDNVFRLSNISPETNHESYLEIIDCYLGKTELNQIDFRVLSLRITNTHLIDASFVNVYWNYKAKIHSITPLLTDESKTNMYIRAREIYRQLKFAYSKQGDFINEQFFHGLEMNAYDKYLSNNDYSGTKLIIKLSKWTSNYGQSISKPVISLGIVHLILFSILMFTGYYKPLHFDLCNSNLNDTWQGIGHFFETMNPLRKYETPINYLLIDLSMRIWASYMIYNFIRASRRFIK